MKVKICGNTSAKDAAECARLGADFIGVIVDVPVDTPRKVSAEKASEIFSAVRASAGKVAVVMPKTAEEAASLYWKARPDFLQLHGAESVALVKELRDLVPCSIIKAIHVEGESSIKEAERFISYCDALLLDTPSRQMGGSGKAHGWSVSRKIVEEVGIPVILAGGLNPENIREAIEAVEPYAVDVSSGVEKKEGRKDYTKVKRFIKNAKYK